MLRILSCIAVEHDLKHLLLAILICILGCVLTMRLFARSRRTLGLQKANWLFLSGFVGGSTIWTTHFISMLGYETPLAAGYDVRLTLLSLAAGVVAALAGFSLAASSSKSLAVEAGGAIVGLGIASMHYIGIAGYEVVGRFEWETPYVVASIILGAFFGAMATARVARPVTRFCRYGGAICLILAIASTHFVGMAALTVVPDSAIGIPPELISTAVMTALVAAVMFVILILGASTYVIDQQTTQAALERYRHLALHDPLTNLPNRTAFNEHLSQLVNNPNQLSSDIAVLTFDLDRFKEINDVHGHAAGDAVLRTVAERLGALMQKDQFVARVGGDEFTAITRHFLVSADAKTMAQRIVQAISKPIPWNDQILSVGASVGISTFPTQATVVDDLLSQADAAMYRAKASGSNTICFYDLSMDQAARDRNILAMEMRDGLRDGQFELFYQQQNDTRSREVVGYEALLRWKHPVRGFISPGEFIPIAEKSGFILELGEWVLRTACREAASWRNPLRIAVNVAAQQLSDVRLPQLVHEVLLETGLAASRLELEITESGIIEDHQHALHAIRRLKTLGVKIAMDDYGTGYSSLSTLQTFPFDKIKIDRAFIDGLVDNVQSAAIVRSTLILASSLGIPVLAEGVESEEHIRFLQDEGCLQVQGFLFGRPLPSRDIGAITGLDRNGTAKEKPEATVEAQFDQASQEAAA